MQKDEYSLSFERVYVESGVGVTTGERVMAMDWEMSTVLFVLSENTVAQVSTVSVDVMGIKGCLFFVSAVGILDGFSKWARMLRFA